MTRLAARDLAHHPALLVATLTFILVAVGVGLTISLMRQRFSAQLRRLEAQIKRVGAGDYTPVMTPSQDEEIQRLSLALAHMTEALADRERRIHLLASREPITNRLNRATFLDTVALQLDRHAAAIFTIGLMRTHEIVNTVGREIADRVLRDVSARLDRMLCDAPVACLDDRTFAVFLRNVSEAGARNVAAAIIQECEEPYRERDLTIDAGVAVGVALMPRHGTGAVELLHRAEVALSAARRSDHHWAIYDTAIDPYRPERLSLMSDLRRGLLADELSLHYQPKLHIPSGRVTGVEALVRWRHPRHGAVAPDDFVRLAEETGNVRHLTSWALRTGIAQAARWRDAGVMLQTAINLSARDLTDPRLPDAVDRLLAEHDLAPGAVSLEVTESAIMADPADAIAVLRGFAEREISVALDDFGRGQTSLTYLRTLPVRELKIDKAFVQHLASDADDRKIVRSVIELGHALGFAVTAEGVEDAASLDVLGGLGCDYAQGFHISRPLPGEMMLGFGTHYRRPIPLPTSDTVV